MEEEEILKYMKSMGIDEGELDQVIESAHRRLDNFPAIQLFQYMMDIDVYLLERVILSLPFHDIMLLACVSRELHSFVFEVMSMKAWRVIIFADLGHHKNKEIYEELLNGVDECTTQKELASYYIKAIDELGTEIVSREQDLGNLCPVSTIVTNHFETSRKSVILNPVDGDHELTKGGRLVTKTTHKYKDIRGPKYIVREVDLSVVGRYFGVFRLRRLGSFGKDQNLKQVPLPLSLFVEPMASVKTETFGPITMRLVYGVIDGADLTPDNLVTFGTDNILYDSGPITTKVELEFPRPNVAHVVDFFEESNLDTIFCQVEFEPVIGGEFDENDLTRKKGGDIKWLGLGTELVDVSPPPVNRFVISNVLFHGNRRLRLYDGDFSLGMIRENMSRDNGKKDSFIGEILDRKTKTSDVDNLMSSAVFRITEDAEKSRNLVASSIGENVVRVVDINKPRDSCGHLFHPSDLKLLVRLEPLYRCPICAH